jgi:hypothetical protein
LLCAASVCQAQECNRQTAPGKFELTTEGRASSGFATDVGIKPTGFVDLKSGAATVHGIDVSKYQDEANFSLAYKCGARFAYIRLSGGENEQNDHMYRLHWPNARAAQLLTGPYHNLSVIPAGARRWYSAKSDERPAILRGLKSIASASGRTQAQMFLGHLDEMLSFEVQGQNGARPTYLPIAIDLSTDPLPAANDAERQQFGVIFGTVACSFVQTVRSNQKTAHAKIILFARPHIYAAYGLNRSECGLEELPVWISYHSRDGDRYDAPGASGDKAAVDYLCRPRSADDRCIIQQYTSFGGFAVFKPGSPLDLDRFYGNEDQLRALLQTY